MSKHSTAMVSVKILPNTASSSASEVVFETDLGLFTGLKLVGSPSGKDVAEQAT